jgi:putative zinc finger/helix-turn-helix YgiT family protein
MNGFCPNCEKVTQQKFVERNEELIVRGERIPVVMEFYHCEECGEDFEKPRQDYDPVEVAFRIYREQRGMLQPEQIMQFRKRIGLTQKELSSLLGIGIATLNRYENGALQSEAHDSMMRLCMQPRNLLKVAGEKSENFSPERSGQIIEAINAIDHSEDLIAEAIEQFASYDANVYSGNELFNIEKLFQVIKYFCFNERVYKTKLMKLLFYADFKHFKTYGTSITGARYAHAKHGPVLDKFETWLTAISEWRNELQVEEQISGEYVGEAYFTDEHDWSEFPAAELATLATVKDKFQNFSARQIREFSHEEEGYKQTRSGELISYVYARELRV